MPKMKTHSGAKKRFRLTGTGKIFYKKANRGHLMVQKNSKRARRLEQPAELAPENTKIVKRLLGI